MNIGTYTLGDAVNSLLSALAGIAGGATYGALTFQSIPANAADGSIGGSSEALAKSGNFLTAFVRALTGQYASVGAQTTLKQFAVALADAFIGFLVGGLILALQSGHLDLIATLALAQGFYGFLQGSGVPYNATNQFGVYNNASASNSVGASFYNSTIPDATNIIALVSPLFALPNLPLVLVQTLNQILISILQLILSPQLVQLVVNLFSTKEALIANLLNIVDSILGPTQSILTDGVLTSAFG